MSKIFKIFIAITIAIVIIIIARPYVRDYKEHKQYAFKVNTIDGVAYYDFKIFLNGKGSVFTHSTYDIL